MAFRSMFKTLAGVSKLKHVNKVNKRVALSNANETYQNTSNNLKLHSLDYK